MHSKPLIEREQLVWYIGDGLEGGFLVFIRLVKKAIEVLRL